MLLSEGQPKTIPLKQQCAMMLKNLIEMKQDAELFITVMEKKILTKKMNTIS